MTPPPGPVPTCPAILILSAGASSRMRGADKLLEPVRGRPLLADRVAEAIACTATGTGPAASAVIVTLPPRALAPQRWAALAGSAAQLVTVEDRDEGMSASFRTGMAALPSTASGVLILPADMPDLTRADLALVIAAFDGETILRGASADGVPGHPVLFPARDLAALADVSGDRGGRDLLKASANAVRLVPLPGTHALTDLDTPEDWAAWRAAST